MCNCFFTIFSFVLLSFGVCCVVWQYLEWLFRANEEGGSCPAGLCGSCLAHASNEEVLCVSCNKLQENVWRKHSEKCCLHYLWIKTRLRHCVLATCGLFGYSCNAAIDVKCVVSKSTIHNSSHLTCRLRFSWSSTRLGPLWPLVEDQLSDERQSVRSWESVPRNDQYINGTPIVSQSITFAQFGASIVATWLWKLCQTWCNMFQHVLACFSMF